MKVEFFQAFKNNFIVCCFYFDHLNCVSNVHRDTGENFFVILEWVDSIQMRFDVVQFFDETSDKMWLTHAVNAFNKLCPNIKSLILLLQECSLDTKSLAHYLIRTNFPILFSFLYTTQLGVKKFGL